MRRLGERREYGPYAGTLGRAVHADFHTYTLPLSAQFVVENLSGNGHEEQLPAGPDSHWFVGTGRGKLNGYDFPPDWFLAALDRRGQREEAVKRIWEAWKRLSDWEPAGDALRWVIYTDCMAQRVALDTSRGWKHSGKKFYKERVLAWEIIGVLAVDPEVLRDAQAAGAVDERALAWAEEKRLVDRRVT